MPPQDIAALFMKGRGDQTKGMRTAYEGPDVFCQNEPEFAGDEVDPMTQ
jgi:hypothetical protein